MSRGAAIGGLGLDKLIHERARLMILAYLASAESPETGFTELRDGLGFTAGNLSIQLKTLEEAGYIRIEKRFRDNKPFTGVGLTVEGEGALKSYLEDLEVIVASLKRGGAADVDGGEGAGGAGTMVSANADSAGAARSGTDAGPSGAEGE